MHAAHVAVDADVVDGDIVVGVVAAKDDEDDGW